MKFTILIETVCVFAILTGASLAKASGQSVSEEIDAKSHQILEKFSDIVFKTARLAGQGQKKIDEVQYFFRENYRDFEYEVRKNYRGIGPE